MRLHVLHRIEAAAITIATGGAVSGLKGIDPGGVPLDRWGMYADVVAGSFAFAHFAHHKRGAVKRWARMAGAALSLNDGALAREAAAQGLVATRHGIMRYGRPSQTLGRERAKQDLLAVGYESEEP